MRAALQVAQGAGVTTARRHGSALPVICAFVASFLALPAGASAATWEAAASTHVAHGQSHTSTALHGSDVLVAGGLSDGDASSAGVDLYDVQAGGWATVVDMSVPRASHTATRLHNGEVVVAGGIDQRSCWPETCEIVIHDTAEAFNPQTGSWSPLAPMVAPRTHHDAVLLHDGRVLVTGGFDPVTTVPTAEAYQPNGDTWSAVAPMATPRFSHRSILLHNGKVLVTGGYDVDGDPLASAELYDPVKDVWTPTGSMSSPRADFTATRLDNGEVLAAGGIETNPFTSPTFVGLSTAETFDPKTGTWTPTHAMTGPRFAHAAVRLVAGSVLVAGGEDAAFHPIGSAEVYDAGARAWTAAPAMGTARAAPAASSLPGGRVLVTGGFVLGQSLTSAELYTP